MIKDAVLSALVNLVLLVFIPFVVYFVYQKWRKKRGFAEVAERAGLRIGETRFILIGVLFSALTVAVLVIWPPGLEPFLREGSPQRSFAGLGFSGTSLTMALLYGVVKTGFAEEVLFRGMVAGSLSRRLPLRWANLLQAFIFLLPHLFILLTMPEMWGILPIVFSGALVTGWLRIRSGSIVGPWIMHAAANVTICLSVAIRSTGSV